jgi:hypothetical protein
MTFLSTLRCCICCHLRRTSSGTYTHRTGLFCLHCRSGCPCFPIHGIPQTTALRIEMSEFCPLHLRKRDGDGCLHELVSSLAGWISIAHKKDFNELLLMWDTENVATFVWIAPWALDEFQKCNFVERDTQVSGNGAGWTYGPTPTRKEESEEVSGMESGATVAKRPSISRRMKGELKGEVVFAHHAAQGFYRSMESREVCFTSTSRGQGGSRRGVENTRAVDQSLNTHPLSQPQVSGLCDHTFALYQGRFVLTKAPRCGSCSAPKGSFSDVGTPRVGWTCVGRSP